MVIVHEWPFKPTCHIMPSIHLRKPVLSMSTSYVCSEHLYQEATRKQACALGLRWWQVLTEIPDKKPWKWRLKGRCMASQSASPVGVNYWAGYVLWGGQVGKPSDVTQSPFLSPWLYWHSHWKKRVLGENINFFLEPVDPVAWVTRLGIQSFNLRHICRLQIEIRSTGYGMTNSRTNYRPYTLTTTDSLKKNHNGFTHNQPSSSTKCGSIKVLYQTNPP